MIIDLKNIFIIRFKLVKKFKIFYTFNYFSKTITEIKKIKKIFFKSNRIIHEVIVF